MPDRIARKYRHPPNRRSGGAGRRWRVPLARCSRAWPPPASPCSSSSPSSRSSTPRAGRCTSTARRAATATAATPPGMPSRPSTGRPPCSRTGAPPPAGRSWSRATPIMSIASGPSRPAGTAAAPRRHRSCSRRRATRRAARPGMSSRSCPAPMSLLDPASAGSRAGPRTCGRPRGRTSRSATAPTAAACARRSSRTRPAGCGSSRRCPRSRRAPAAASVVTCGAAATCTPRRSGRRIHRPTPSTS